MTKQTERGLFESKIKKLFDWHADTFNTDYNGRYYVTVCSKTYQGQLQPRYSDLSMLFDVWQAARAQQPIAQEPPKNSEIANLLEALGRAKVIVEMTTYDEAGSVLLARVYEVRLTGPAFDEVELLAEEISRNTPAAQQPEAVPAVPEVFDERGLFDQWEEHVYDQDEAYDGDRDTRLGWAAWQARAAIENYVAIFVPVVPEGWKLVPKFPTFTMLESGVKAFQKAYSSRDVLADWRATYIGMLAAAPPAPTQSGGNGS